MANPRRGSHWRDESPRYCALAIICIAVACGHWAPNAECALWVEQQVPYYRCVSYSNGVCTAHQTLYHTQHVCHRTRCQSGFYAPDGDPGHGCYAGDEYERRHAAYLAAHPEEQKPTPIYDQGQANGASINPTFSPDGKSVAFASAASNLVANDVNNAIDIFVVTLSSGAITRVSIATNGDYFSTDTLWPSFSADGAKVYFTTDADHARWSKDLKTGEMAPAPAKEDTTPPALAHCTQLTHLSASANGKRRVADCYDGVWNAKLVDNGTVQSLCPKANNSCLHPSISRDGTQVAFISSSTNLVADDDNHTDVYVTDLHGYTRVSTASNGTPGNDSSKEASISPDGSRVAFSSDATNLVDHDTNLASDIFVKDLRTGVTQRISAVPR